MEKGKALKITNVRINGIKNPIGFQYESLSCSWNVEEAKGKKQIKAIIEVSSDPRFQNLLLKKEGADLKSAGEKLILELAPRTTYYLRVSVQSDAGEMAQSETAVFETGKMKEPWQAKWIAAGREDTFHPVLRKSFEIGKEVVRARLYCTGVGLFEAWLDGEKIGEEYLTPYATDYDSSIQVITFPLEEKLWRKGEHSLSIILGKGWYMGVFGLGLTENNYGSRMAAIAELHLEYADGSSSLVVTNESWEVIRSDVVDSGIYLGEVLDRTQGQKGNPVKPAVVLENPWEEEATRNLSFSKLSDRLSLPVLAKESLSVKEVIHTPAGETVLDMGQNFAGFVEFYAKFPAGTKITLDFGEILQGGNFYNGNYRDAKSQFVYVSDGRVEIVRPHFTFFGFRYVRVGGWPGEVDPRVFKGRVLYSDIQRTGYLSTSDAKINRLYENTLWGLKSNFIDMPTDCPQRSERLGWTGDAQVFAPTASYHMDTRAFFHKFVGDLRTEQKVLGGGMPNYLPNIGHTEMAGSAWGDIATFLPDTLYTYYGNKEEAAYAYPLMKEWVDFIDRGDAARGEKTYLFDFLDTFGDWLALDGATPTSFKGSTDDVYVSTAYYYRSAHLVRKMAEVLGKSEDAAHYKELEEKIRQALLAEFFTPTGRLSIDTQAAYVIALHFGIWVDKEKLIRQFKLRLKRDMYQIKCGFAGAPLLCTVLAEAGEFELAYDFLLKEGFPSWLYSVNLGATTIWERWNSVGEDGVISNTGMNSLNHYAYGSVMEFMYAYAAGIRPLEPGFKKAILAPHPDIRIPKISGSYASVNGTYRCGFEIKEDGKLLVEIAIPFGCEARVELPGYEEEVLFLPSGSYTYCYTPKTDLRKPYSKKTTLARIAKDGAAMEILGRYTPVLAGIAASGDPEMGSNSLEELSHIGYLPFDPNELQKAIAEISDLVCG